MWTGTTRLARVNLRHLPSKTSVGVLPWTCWSEWKWLSRHIGAGQSNCHKWFSSGKSSSVEELKTLHAGTKQRHHTRGLLEERDVEKESINVRAWEGEKGISSISPKLLKRLERSVTWENLFEGRGEAHISIPERVDITLNWFEVVVTVLVTTTTGLHRTTQLNSCYLFCIETHTHTHTHTRNHPSLSTRHLVTHTHTHTHTHACTHARTHARTHAHTHSIHTHPCAHMHTDTHKQYIHLPRCHNVKQ